jgi:hypothetical protein
MMPSELKSAVFAMKQSFNRAVPMEEQLQQLSAVPTGRRALTGGGTEPNGAVFVATACPLNPAETGHAGASLIY